MYNRNGFSGYQQEDDITIEAKNYIGRYNYQQLQEAYSEVCGRLEFMDRNAHTMDQATYNNAVQARPKLLFQYEALKRAFALLDQGYGQVQSFSSYNAYGQNQSYNGSGTHLNTGITRTTQTGFGGGSVNRYNSPDRQMSGRPSTGSRYIVKDVVVDERNYRTEQPSSVIGGFGSRPVQEVKPIQVPEQVEIKTKGDFTMANTVRGSVYPYACLNNKINTDGSTLGFELGNDNTDEFAEVLSELKNGGVTISVHPELLYYAFKSDNNYKSLVGSGTITASIEPMKNLIESTVEALGADKCIVEARITDILSELLRREGVFNIEDTLSKADQMGDEDWELIDNHILGKDESIEDLKPLATIHKNFNFVYKTKEGLYTYLYRMMTWSSSLVNGVFADNVFEVFVNLEGRGIAFLDFLNKRNFEKFVVNKECNSPLFYILEEACKKVKESNALVSKIANFCNLSLRITDETGFEYRILVEPDFMKEAFYVSNANNAVLVNQVYVGIQGGDDEENAE